MQSGNLWKFYFDPEGKKYLRHLIKRPKQNAIERKHGLLHFPSVFTATVFHGEGPIYLGLFLSTSWIPRLVLNVVGK